MAPPTTTGEQMPSARDVILKHIDAVNAHDNDAEPWAADAELVAPGGHANGRHAVLGFLDVFHEAFPDIRLEIKQLLTDGSAAAAEGNLSGTHTGCSTPHAATSRRQDEPLNFGGRRFTSPRPTR